MKCEKCGRHFEWKSFNWEEVPNYCSECTWDYALEEAKQYGMSEEEFTQKIYKSLMDTIFTSREDWEVKRNVDDGVLFKNEKYNSISNFRILPSDEKYVSNAIVELVKKQ